MATYVIAGNYEEYKTWLWFQKGFRNNPEYIYVDDINKLRGVRGKDLILIGQYWKNKAYQSDQFEFISKDFVIIAPSNTKGGD